MDAISALVGFCQRANLGSAADIGHQQNKKGSKAQSLKTIGSAAGDRSGAVSSTKSVCR